MTNESAKKTKERLDEVYGTETEQEMKERIMKENLIRKEMEKVHNIMGVDFTGAELHALEMQDESEPPEPVPELSDEEVVKLAQELFRVDISKKMNRGNVTNVRRDEKGEEEVTVIVQEEE